jgi:stage II sporulation protein D
VTDRPIDSKPVAAAALGASDGAHGVDDVAATSRRRVIRVGLAAAAGLAAWGCSGGREPDAATPPRVTRQTRPASGASIDPRPPVPRSEPSIRVLVGRLEGATSSLRLSAPGRWIRVRDASERAGTVMPSPVELAKDGERWRLAGTTGPVLRLPIATLTFSTTPGEPESLAATFTSRGREIRLELGSTVSVVPSETSGEHVDLVATLPLERYLPGVLAKELYRQWSPATFQAQAIAARSFAVCELAYWAKRRHFDVTTGPDTQAWDGLVTSGMSARAARETRGVVLAWDERVVPAYYSSCCGGLPADAADAIAPGPANSIPPLAGRNDGGACCEWSSTYRWERRVPVRSLADGLIAWGRRESVAELAALDGLRRLEVSAVNRHGRPVRFRFEDGQGRSAELRSERARRAIASATPASAGAFYSAAVDPRMDGATVTFVGRGHGHGAGMCQHGAEAMARSGATSESIVRRYFPGAILASGWG